MWNIFVNKDLDINQTIEAVNIWKELVYSKINIKVKRYIAEKIVVYFDNRIIFKKEETIHEILMHSLSKTEKDIEEINKLFPDVYFYLIPENKNNMIITFNLPNEKDYLPEEKFKFNLVNNNLDFNYNKLKEFKSKSWENLVFSIDISDLANGWINYTPSLDKRIELQTKFILLNKMKNKKSLIEQINFQENIETSKSYNELYEKIKKIMPKIEDKLNSEWREVVIQGEVPEINIKRKNQI